MFLGPVRTAVPVGAVYAGPPACGDVRVAPAIS